MKRVICLLILFASIHSAQAQYLPVVKQDRVWYSFIDGWFDGTVILSVGPDSIVNGRSLPTLVTKDQNLNKVEVIGTLDEDTIQGTLEVEFFSGRGYTLDFSTGVGDSMKFDLISGDSAYLKVVRKYSFVDFRNVTRRVLELQAPPQAFCNSAKINIVEGLGPLGSFVNPNHDCSVSDIPMHTLRCAFDDGEKIYGDTVQQCFVLSDEVRELRTVSIFPNPAGDFLKVEADEEALNYEILNSNGAAVQAGEIQNGFISVKALIPGSYIINLKSEGGKTYSKQFIKQ